MVKLFIATALTLSANVTLADTFQTEVPVICADTSTVLEGLQNEYSEEIKFIGSKDRTDTVFTTLWTNSETGTWTIVITSREEGVTCLLNEGKGGYQLFSDDINT